jgi:cytolysin-activating lysine-acyltransferase
MTHTVSGTPERTSILGEIVWLLGYSDLHRDWPIGSIRQWVLPAIEYNQFRVYRRHGKPQGYVSWAWMSKACEEAYITHTPSLNAEDWQSGSRGWIIDFVAPFGDAKAMVRDLRHNIFPNQVGRALRTRKGSDTLYIHYLHGARALARARDRNQNPTVTLPHGEDIGTTHATRRSTLDRYEVMDHD